MATTTPRPLTAVRPLITAAEVCDFVPGEGAADADGAWVPVAVPGDVHTALVGGGPHRGPVLRPQRGRVRVDGGARVVVPRGFDGPEAPAPGERLRLVFHGLDTYATVFLNGSELGRHANMFREAAFDVSEHVLPGENRLAIRFDPPLAHAGPRDPEQWSSTPAERVWMRKAQYGFGWDWGPRLPTIGIWRPVELRRERGAVAHARELRHARDRPRRARRGRRRGGALHRRRRARGVHPNCGRPVARCPPAQL